MEVVNSVPSAGSIFERYRIDTEVVIGDGFLLATLCDYCASLGPAGLLVFGRGQSYGARDRSVLVAALRDRGLDLQVVSNTHSNISFGDLQQLAAEVDPNKVFWVVAIGGAGVIDAGKILALRMRQDLAIRSTDCFEDLRSQLDTLVSFPLVAVPTCIGSGAEVSCLSDVLLDSLGVRTPIISPAIYPSLALVDCASIRSPSSVQAAAIVDTATHLLDPWLNSLPATFPQQDTAIALLRSLVRMVQGWSGGPLPTALLPRLATISHLAVRPGLARTSSAVSALHRIEHVLSSQYRLRHGEVLAILLPGFLRWLERARTELAITVADTFADIFGCYALPSILVEKWLSALPLEHHDLRTQSIDADKIAETVIRTFGDDRGMLPGGLLLEHTAVRAIVHDAVSNWPATPQAHSHSTVGIPNANRVFGGILPAAPYHVVFTPIRLIFDVLCQVAGTAPRSGWFTTAVTNNEFGTPVLLVFSSPGKSMAEDCLTFLSLATCHPESILFIGFAGSLTVNFRCGDLVAPQSVLPLEDAGYADGTKAFVLQNAGIADIGTARTVRSVRRMTDESPSLLKAWHWAGVDLIDMESSGVAAWCSKAETPLSVLFVVSDQPTEHEPLWMHPPSTASSPVIEAAERLARIVARQLAEPTWAITRKGPTYGLRTHG